MQEKHKRKHMKEWNFGIYEVVNNFLTAAAQPPPPQNRKHNNKI